MLGSTDFLPLSSRTLSTLLSGERFGTDESEIPLNKSRSLEGKAPCHHRVDHVAWNWRTPRCQISDQNHSAKALLVLSEFMVSILAICHGIDF